MMSECGVPIMGHCDLDSDLVYRLTMSGAYLLHYLR